MTAALPIHPFAPVVFDEAILWQVYPNPSQGNFYLIYQLNKNERVEAKVYDISGKLVKESQAVANGFAQKLSIDLSTGKFASGMYVLKIKAGNKEQFFKLHKL